MPARRVYYVPEALADYAVELGSLGLAANTVSGQNGYLARFGRICDEVARERGKRNPLTVEEIDARVISRYFATSSGTQGNLNNMLYPLKGFLAWCTSAGWLDSGAVTRLIGTRKYKKPVREPKYYIPAGQFGDMLDTPGLVHPSQRMAIALFLYSLGRRGEIGGLRLKDVDLAGGLLHVYRQKRKRWTDVGICPELNEELIAWLGLYGKEFGLHAVDMMEQHPEWMLLPRLKWAYEYEQGRMARVTTATLDPEHSPGHLERLVKLALDHLEVTGTRDGKRVRHLGEGCHTIRRSGARAMLDHLSRDLGHERALLQVATMLDHDDTKQTLLYIGLDQERRELNDWLRSNSPYGRRPEGGGKVIPIRRVS